MHRPFGLRQIVVPLQLPGHAQRPCVGRCRHLSQQDIQAGPRQQSHCCCRHPSGRAGAGCNRFAIRCVLLVCGHTRSCNIWHGQTQPHRALHLRAKALAHVGCFVTNNQGSACQRRQGRCHPKPCARTCQHRHPGHATHKAHINRMPQPGVARLPHQLLGREGIHRQPVTQQPQITHRSRHQAQADCRQQRSHPRRQRQRPKRQPRIIQPPGPTRQQQRQHHSEQSTIGPRPPVWLALFHGHCTSS